jgi:hypothetical protein
MKWRTRANVTKTLWITIDRKKVVLHSELIYFITKYSIVFIFSCYFKLVLLQFCSSEIKNNSSDNYLRIGRDNLCLSAFSKILNSKTETLKKKTGIARAVFI